MDSTVYRHLDTVSMVVGPESGFAQHCKAHFEELQIRVVRVLDAAEACEELARVMPQLVLVVGALDDAERERVVDRTTAVGAFLVQLDPELDGETRDTLLDRAAKAAVERGRVRDA